MSAVIFTSCSAGFLKDLHTQTNPTTKVTKINAAMMFAVTNAVLYPNRITTSLDKRNVDIQTLQYTDFLSVFTSLKGVKHAEILLW